MPAASAAGIGASRAEIGRFGRLVSRLVSRLRPAPRSSSRPELRTIRATQQIPGTPEPPVARSWWAARAKAGEVAPGFSRDAILRPAKEDPRAEGGVFTRVGGLLRELSADGSIG